MKKIQEQPAPVKQPNMMRNLLAVLLTALLFPNIIGLLIYPGNRDKSLDALNYRAEQAADGFQTGRIDLPETGTLYMSGRIGGTYMTVDPDRGEPYFVYGNESTAFECRYWTALVENGAPVKVWCAEQPLSQDALQAYTPEMQRKAVHFVPFPLCLQQNWADLSDAAGYYETAAE